MSELKVNKISPRSGTDVTLGDSGDTFTIPAGATITNNGTANGFDTDTNDKVKVSSNDTTAGFLNGKLVAGTNITLTEGSDGGNETLTIASAAQAITATANGADNRIATYSAASTLNGEANLTFDGSTLALTGNMTVSGTVDGQDVAAVATTANAALPKAGGTMTGNLDFGDNDYIRLGDGSDLRIYHDGSNSFIQDAGTGDLIIQGTNTLIRNNNGDTGIDINEDSSVDLYFDNAKKLATTTGGIDVTGAITVNGAALAGGVELFDVQVITSTSTYTPTSGTKFVRVYATGGGSGAGGIASDQYNEFWGNGGNGGNTGVKTYTASELGSTAAISIGSGGSGGSGNANGSDGGSTTFDPAGSGATLSGIGGKGGYGQGVDGIGSSNPDYAQGGGNADYVIYGEFPSGNVGRRSISTDKFWNLAAAGGGSAFGRGGNGYRSTSANFSHIGNAGTLGGGGGGAMAIASQGSYAGGAGGSGLVVIEEYK
tara:strand:+ start:351 stop:1808 length:1458 start_codon:yes stop_codon:yes gene_type:complete